MFCLDKHLIMMKNNCQMKMKRMVKEDKNP